MDVGSLGEVPFELAVYLAPIPGRVLTFKTLSDVPYALAFIGGRKPQLPRTPYPRYIYRGAEREGPTLVIDLAADRDREPRYYGVEREALKYELLDALVHVHDFRSRADTWEGVLAYRLHLRFPGARTVRDLMNRVARAEHDTAVLFECVRIAREERLRAEDRGEVLPTDWVF